MEKQISIFDWMPEAVPCNEETSVAELSSIIIQAGPSIEDGIYRIAKAIEDDRLSPSFLLGEYGIGGKTVSHEEYGTTWIDYSVKGIRVFRNMIDGLRTDLIPWRKVADIWKEAQAKRRMNIDRKKYLAWCEKYSGTYGPAQNVWTRA